jgi:hypothetical protein
MNKKKVIISVLLVAIFVMSGFAISANSLIVNNSNSSGNLNTNVAQRDYGNIKSANINVNILGMDNFIARLFSAGRIDHTFVYNGITIHCESNKIKNNEVKANFFVNAENFNKKTSVTIINKNNTYYIINNKMNKIVKISSNNNEIIYDPGGTYSYYVSSTGSASHSWTTPVSSGHWSACSKTIVKSNTAFLTWNGPRLIFVLGMPELYNSLLGSYWKESNGDGWAASCGHVPLNMKGPEMPLSGHKTLHNYHGADTSVKVTVTWDYTPVLFGI